MFNPYDMYKFSACQEAQATLYWHFTMSWVSKNTIPFNYPFYGREYSQCGGFDYIM